MAVFTGRDLKAWREAQGISAADLAERISCDATTIYRYEAAKLKPNPDVMYQICEALGDVDVWTTWMRTEYPASYARVHPETSLNSLQGAILGMYGEIGDVLDIQRRIMKDGADGEISDKELATVALNEITELLQSAQRVKNIIKSCADNKKG